MPTRSPLWLPIAVAGILLACAACGSKSATRDTASTESTPAPAATTTARKTTATATSSSGCRVAPPALTKLVRAGLAFPGPGKLERARLVGKPGAYYFAARIVPPGKSTPVGTGVWAAKSLSPKGVVVAVNKTAGSYSDWRRADTPLNATARRWVTRATRCVG